MANNRYVDTNFWKDTYIIDLDPTEKLLFLYLLTNPRTTIAGIYEISLREIAFDTGIDRDMVQKILDRFSRDGKIIYLRGWLVMRNWIKHQKMNPNVESGIERITTSLPKWLREEIITTENGGQLSLDTEPTDSLSKPSTLNLYLTKPNLTKPNAHEPHGFKKTIQTPAQKRSYAIAMQAEREQAARATAARNRNGSTKSVEEIFGDRHGAR